MRCVINKLSINFSKPWLVFVAIMATLFLDIQAEGVQQLAPTEADSPIMLESGRPDFANFAAYDGPENGRLYVSIADPSEVVYLGLSIEYSNGGSPYSGNENAARYRFRIKRVNDSGVDPVVHGPFLITRNNANLNTWSDAEYGNYDVTTVDVNGDLMYEFHPGEAGDYYIEFDDDINSDSNDNTNIFPFYRKVNIGLWDITVTDNGTPVEGRVWSKNWALRTPEVTGATAPDCEWDRQFRGEFYSYTTDGFVSKIDFADAGMQGLTFLVAFNSKGPGISGDLALDRMSIPNVNATINASEHKIFLSPPDPSIFPSGLCGTIEPASSFQCSGLGTYCIDVTVSKPGQVELIIDFNQNGILDPESQDVSIVYEFLDGTLTGCIPWDGLRGDGSPIGITDTVDLIFNYAQGIQHWSAYDVEFMRNGYCIETIRPICSGQMTSNQLYWDDRNVTDDPGTGSLKDGRNGCDCETGCRSWDNFNINSSNCNNVNDANTTGYGDKTTLNTWWFATSTSTSRVNIPLVSIMIEGPDTICGGDIVTFTAEDDGATGNIGYSWTGPEGFTGNTASVDVSAAGEYCVTVTDELGCSNNTCKTLTVLDTGEGTIGFPENINACIGDQVTISPIGDTAGFTFMWSPISGGIVDPTLPSQTIDFSANIMYMVEITNQATACSFIDTIDIIAFPDPILNFTADVGCENGLEINFINQSTNAASYAWDFGVESTNTDVSTDPSPSYTYPAIGEYLVTLVATSADGCETTLSQSITIVDVPLMADFDVSYTNCDANSVTVQLTNTSINGANNTSSYSWSFNASPFNSNLENPSITLTAGQSMTVLLTILTDDGCLSSDTQTFDVQLGPPSNQFPEDLVVCRGESVQIQPAGNPTYSYSWSPLEGIDDPNSAQPTFNPINTTTYTVTVTSSGVDDCIVIETVDVLVPDDINLEVSGGGNFCTATTTLTATTNVDAAIVWYNVENDSIGEGNSLTVDVSGEESYTVIATDPFGCSDVVANVSVSGGPVDFTAPDTVAICLDEEVILSVTNLDANDILTYSWTPVELFVPGTATNAIPDFIEAGGAADVNVQLTNQFGCQAEANIHVSDINLEVTGGGNFCTATTTLTATTSLDATIVWYNVDNDSIGEGNSLTVDVSGVSNYTAIATDLLGCSDAVTDITVSGGPVNITTPDTVAVCLGEEIILSVTNLDANDVLTYSWTPVELFVPGTATNAIPDFIEAGGAADVNVQLTNQFGCQTEADIHVAVVDPTIDLSFTSLIDCMGGTVTFTNTSTNAFGYVWNFGDGSALSYEESPVHMYDAAGTYTVTLDIIYDVSCVEEPFSQEILVETPEIIADFTYDITTCSADSAVVQFFDNSTNSLDNTIGYAWTFDGASPATSMDQNPTVTVYNTSAVEVSFTIVTANDCNHTYTETLDIQLVDLDISLTDTIVVCPSFSTILNPDGDPELVYAWTPISGLDDPTATSPIATPTETTTYFSTAYSLVGSDTCFVSDSVVVFVPEDINLVLDQEPVVVTCGEDVTITATADVPFDIVWESTLDGVLEETTSVITVNPFQTDTIIATVTDQYGCTATDSIIINDIGVDISVSPSTSLVICDDVEAELSVVNLDPLDVLTYEWSPEEYIVGASNLQNVIVRIDELGEFTITSIVNNQHGCADTVDIMVLVEEFAGLQLDTIVVCADEATPINPGGDPELIYNWSPNDEFLDLTNPSNPVVTTSMPLTYYVTITDTEFGCTAMDSIFIDISPQMNLNVTPPSTTLCSEGTVTLTANTDIVPANVDWFLISDPVDEALGSGTEITFTPPLGAHQVYAVSTSDAGCTERDTITINNFPINATITAPIVFCEPTAMVDLEVINNDPDQDLTVVWNLDPVEEGPVVTVDLAEGETSFSATVTNQYGCSEDFSTMVTVIDLLGNMDIVAVEDSILLNESSTITVSGCIGCEYVWDPEAENSPVIVVTPTEAGENIYTVTASLLGCENTLDVTVFVLDAMCDIDHVYFPNAFTPNDDGENDDIRLYSNFIDELLEFELLIYDRWGEEVYHSFDQNEGWDGTFRNELLAPDVYGYYLRVLCPMGEELIQKGNITLLR